MRKFAIFLGASILAGSILGAYHWAALGWGEMIFVLLTVALTNKALDICDWRFGMMGGGLLALLMTATLLGSAELPLVYFLTSVLTAAVAGFLFGYLHITNTDSPDSGDKNSEYTSGKGGDFGGGGASGKY